MNRSVLIRFVIALVLLIVASGGHMLWSERLQTVTDSTIASAQQISEARTKLNRAKSEQTELDNLANDESAIYSHLVTNNSIVSFLGILEKTGSVPGVNVSIASVFLETSTKTPMLGVSIKVTGPFDAVMHSVGVIENISYYVTVNTLTIKDTVSSNKKENHWTATFKLNVGFVHSTKSTTP